MFWKAQQRAKSDLAWDIKACGQPKRSCGTAVRRHYMVSRLEMPPLTGLAFGCMFVSAGWLPRLTQMPPGGLVADQQSHLIQHPNREFGTHPASLNALKEATCQTLRLGAERRQAVLNSCDMLCATIPRLKVSGVTARASMRLDRVSSSVQITQSPR